MTRHIFYLAAIAFFLVFFLIMFSCANQVAPTGGKKDTTPPKILSSIPDNKSVNFNGKKITLKFSEYVALDNPFTQVVISPPLEKFPDLTLKGKSLVITFKEPLKENTTYTINFGTAIKDITEGNIMKDYSFVFSTGAYLDSLRISGTVLDAEKSQPVEDVLVMLYKDLDDSVVYKHRPYYFGRTNKAGQFTINNIKEGTYKLFALKDANFNLLYDQVSEAVAFEDTNIVITGDTTIKKNYRLTLFTERSNNLRLIDAAGKTKETNQYIYSGSIERLKIVPIDTAKNMKGNIFEWNPTRDTILQWLTYSVLNPKVFITANDSVRDTMALKRPAFIIDSAYLKTSGKLTFTTTIKSLQGEETQNLYIPLKFYFNRPIQTFDTTKILLYVDTSWASRVNAYFSFNDSLPRKLEVVHAWKADVWYGIYLQKGAFTDIYGKTSDSTRYLFHVLTPEDYGTFNLVLEHADPLMHYIVILQDDKGNIVNRKEVSVLDAAEAKEPIHFGETPKLTEISQMNDTIPLNYKQLEPGNYNLQIILDKNNNGKWDTGNYKQKRQPERIYSHPTPIVIKANWDIRQEIDMR